MPSNPVKQYLTIIHGKKNSIACNNLRTNVRSLPAVKGLLATMDVKTVCAIIGTEPPSLNITLIFRVRYTESVVADGEFVDVHNILLHRCCHCQFITAQDVFWLWDRWFHMEHLYHLSVQVMVHAGQPFCCFLSSPGANDLFCLHVEWSLHGEGTIERSLSNHSKQFFIRNIDVQ